MKKTSFRIVDLPKKKSDGLGPRINATKGKSQNVRKNAVKYNEFVFNPSLGREVPIREAIRSPFFAYY